MDHWLIFFLAHWMKPSKTLFPDIPAFKDSAAAAQKFIGLFHLP
jgi:hypothetical protein